jgi:hypothetical protein
VKEPNFFSTAAPPGEPLLQIQRSSTREEYQLLFKGSGNYATSGDLSTAYLWDENVPGRIREVRPQAKIIIMLRDPVMRAHSQYLMYLSNGAESAPSLWEALQRDKGRNKASRLTSFLYVERGLYYGQVRRYLDTFEKDQVLILLFDDLVRNAPGLFSSVAGHLGIDVAPFAGINLSEAHNFYRAARFQTAYRIAGKLGLRTKLLPPSVRKWLHSSRLLFEKSKPPVDDESRRYLQEIYDPDLTRLEELLGRKFPELRKSWV